MFRGRFALENEIITGLLDVIAGIIIFAMCVDVMGWIGEWYVLDRMKPYLYGKMFGWNKQITLPADIFAFNATPYIVVLLGLGVLLALDIAGILILRKRK